MRKSEPMQNRRLYRLAVSLLVGLWAVTPGWVNALPNGGEIVSGTGSIQQSSNQDMVIQQGSPQLTTNWQGFSIGSAESVSFNQPNSSAVALNRVIGVDPSLISLATVITSARDIKVTAVNINADESSSFNASGDLILNGNVIGDIEEATLATFLTEFFENGGPGGC
jgi:filamentous hemagglutinin family protein